MRAVPRTVAIAVALALAACGQGPSRDRAANGGSPSGSPDSRMPGACPAAAAGSVFEPVSTQLGLPLAWYRVGAVRRTSAPAGAAPSAPHPERDRRVLVVDGAVQVRRHKTVVTPSNDFSVSAQAAAEIPEELRRGAEVLLGVSRDGEADTALSLRRDGTVEFLGVCRHRDGTVRFERAYQRMRASGYTRSRRDFLFAAIDSPYGPEARALSSSGDAPPPAAWTDVPADVRVIAPDAEPTPPAALLASLARVHVTLRLPAAWSRFPGAFCSRSRNGWTECALLSVAASGDAVLAAYVEEGERPQVWLVTNPDDFTTAVGKAGDAAAAAESALAGDATIATYDELRARVARGEPVLR